jgi:hypothetical protein
MVIVTEICKYIKNFKRKNFMACELYLNIVGGFFWLFFLTVETNTIGIQEGAEMMEKALWRRTQF